MFVDYYGILEINETATLREIKSAFRQRAIKWHPDRNHGNDTTKKMQVINEAYLVLKDEEARSRYDREYQLFKAFKRAKEPKEEQSKCQQEQQQKQKPQPEPERKFEYTEYSVGDDVLKRWMANAKRQAVDLAKQTIKDFGGMVSVGVKEGTKAAGHTFLVQIIIGIILLIVFGLSKSCNS